MSGGLLALAARASAGATRIDEGAAEAAAGSAPASAGGLYPEAAEGAEDAELPGADTLDDGAEGSAREGSEAAGALDDADARARAEGAALDDAEQLASAEDAALDAALDDAANLASAGGNGIALDPEAAEAAGPSAAWRLELGFANEAGLAGAFELIEPEPPPSQPWRWGHVDLAIAWRGTYDDEVKGSSRRDELWLLVIWRQ